jgi:hypothetical protein
MMLSVFASTTEGLRSALSEYSDVSSTIPQHSSIQMFRSFPRIGPSITKLSMSKEYLLGITYAVILPAGIGTAVCLVCLNAVIWRYSCCAHRVESRISIRNSKSAVSNMKHLVLSTALTNFAFIFLALGVLGAMAISESLLNILSLTDGLLKYLKNTGLSLVDLVDYLKRNFVQFDSTVFGNKFLSIVFEALKDYIPPLFPDLQALRSNVVTIVDSGVFIAHDLGGIVLLMFTILMVIFVFLFFTFVFMFLSESCARRRVGCRIFLNLLCIFPLALSWYMFALCNGIGTIAADACVTLHDFRAVLLFQNKSEISENLLVNTGLQCASANSSANIQARIDTAIDDFLSNPLTNSTMAVALGVKPADLMAALRWTGSEIEKWIKCSDLIGYTGRYEKLGCGIRESSVMSSVRYMWIGYLFLSISLTMLFMGLTCGCYSSWTSQVWTPTYFGVTSDVEDGGAGDFEGI